MRKFWILCLMTVTSMDAAAKSTVTQIPTTQYVRDYLSTAGKLPDLKLDNVGSFQIPTEKYVMSAIDHVNAENGNETHYADNASSDIPMDLSYFLAQATEKLDTCPVPWTTTPGMLANLDVNWIVDRMTLDTSGWGTISYGKDKFVALAGNYPGSSIGAYSYDGKIWTEIPLPISAMWNAIAYGNNVFVALAGENGSKNDTVLVSSDGITWTDKKPDGTQIKLPVVANWKSVAYGEWIDDTGNKVTQFVALANDIAAVSHDGINWTDKKPDGTQIKLPLSGTSITYCNNTFFASTGGYSYFATSSDGMSWTSKSVPDVYPILFGCGNDTIVTIGRDQRNGIISYSNDGGNTWSDSYTFRADNVDVYYIVYGNGIFIAQGQIFDRGTPAYFSYTYYSVDGGKTWKTPTENFSANSMVFNSNKFVGTSHTGFTILEHVAKSNTNPWAVGNGCSVTDGVISCDAPLVGGVATCENAKCFCTRQKLIKNGEYVDNIAQTPVVINRTFADQNACNLQCANVCADNAVNNTDGIQKDILCGK